MDYIAEASKIEFELKTIKNAYDFLFGCPLKRETEDQLAPQKQELLKSLDKAQKQVKQLKPYAEGTLAAGVLLVILITPILFALLAIFAPILSFPISIILLVLLSTAIVGGITAFALGVQRLRENKDFFLKITKLRNGLNNLRAVETVLIGSQRIHLGYKDSGNITIPS